MSSNNNNNHRTKRASTGSAVVHTMASGPVLADIYRGITPDGHAYLYYVLSRVWHPRSSIRENYSNRFYERNEPQIIEIARKAAEWIRKNPQAADQQYQRPAELPSQCADRSAPVSGDPAGQPPTPRDPVATVPRDRVATAPSGRAATAPRGLEA